MQSKYSFSKDFAYGKEITRLTVIHPEGEIEIYIPEVEIQQLINIALSNAKYLQLDAMGNVLVNTEQSEKIRKEAIIAAYDLAGRVQPTIYSTPTKTIQFFRRRLRIAIWKLLGNKGKGL